MKNIRINGRLARVFVLKESEDSLVYIPVKSLFRVDYDKLCELEKEGGELLKVLSKTTLPNGRNALVQYDNLIQVLRYRDTSKTAGTRVKKPEEAIADLETEHLIDNSKVQPEPQPQPEPEPKPQPEPEPKPQRRKPGPKPGSKRTRKPAGEAKE